MTAVLDDLDRQLLHVLQLDGRAPFRRVAEVLGVSDQTVARRYARMRADRAVRVIGFSDADVVGDDRWLVRARCAPDAAAEVADALARRPDTSWISLTSGGTEIACSLRADPGSGGGELLLGRLPRTPRVLEVSAHQLLHVFYGGATGPFPKEGALSAEQVEAVVGHLPGPVPPPVLDDLDHRLLGLLRTDGRTAVEDLARACGASASTVRRRLADLRGSGLLYFDVDVDPDVAGGDRAMLWLTVLPGDLDAAGRALAAHAEVPFAAATTGRMNLYASVATAGPAALYRYLTTSVAALPGLQAVETAPVIRTVKAAGTHYRAR